VSLDEVEPVVFWRAFVSRGLTTHEAQAGAIIFQLSLNDVCGEGITEVIRIRSEPAGSTRTELRAGDGRESANMGIWMVHSDLLEHFRCG
jgi:hypothetical protein